MSTEKGKSFIVDSGKREEKNKAGTQRDRAKYQGLRVFVELSDTEVVRDHTVTTCGLAVLENFYSQETPSRQGFGGMNLTCANRDCRSKRETVSKWLKETDCNSVIRVFKSHPFLQKQPTSFIHLINFLFITQKSHLPQFG